MPLAAVLLASFVLVACAHKPKQPATPDPATANDAKRMDRMEKAHARALAAPGSASEAGAFAFELTMLYSQGIAQRQKVAPTLVDEAAGCLDSAKDALPDEAPDLLARKGELLLAAGRNDDGIRALRDSIAARPNLRAFNLLAKNYQARNETAEVAPLCKKILPAMKSDESRYAVLDDCIKYSGAASTEAGLRWAPAKDVAFYKARKRDLEARSARAAK
jgi:hypothetical protein